MILDHINPSYTKLFRTHTLYRGGEEGLYRPLHYLINPKLYKPKILQGIRDTFQGLTESKVSRKSFVWLPWQLFDNMVLSLIIVEMFMKKR